jgi:alkanesulfonate monooxygenase SsuD/methylene tetrahydromethanopterin reductase-like flavin-dependent oxidoreductase (luciferase family)
MARAAEEVGFDSVWLGDHMLYRDDGRPERGPWDVWALLAALAATTERVALGPLVACTAFHPPGVLARMAAAVDEISGGRLVVALGAGWNEAEFRAFDVPFDSRVSRFAEAFEIIRRLLAGERVTVEGRFHHAQDAVLLPRPRRRPPLMIGTTGPRMLALTLPHVDAWNSWYDWYGNTLEGFSARNEEITRAARECGRDPAEIERSACVLVAFGDPKERPAEDDAVPVRPTGAAEHLRALAQAGADEAILVVDPIDEDSIRALRPVLAGLEEGA